MSRIAAKYHASHRGTSSREHSAGEVTDRSYGDVTKVVWEQKESLVKGLGIKLPFPKIEKNEKAFKVHLTHAAHDVHGLVEHGKEAEGYRTSKLVKRSVTLAFDDAATAQAALDQVLEIPADALKQLIESETLQTLLKDKMDLFEVPMKSMKPMPRWAVALSVPS